MTDTPSIYSYADESQHLLGHEVSSLIAEGDLLYEPIKESRLQCDNQHIDDKVIPCSFFKDIHDPGWGKQFADLQKTPHTWSMLVEICRMCSQRALQQKTDSRLICPTIFTPTVRKRPTPKKIRKPNGVIFEKHWYDGWRCDENVTEIGVIIPDLDDDFEFETVYSWLIGEGIE